jgi:CHAT domain-containing protein
MTVRLWKDLLAQLTDTRRFRILRERLQRKITMIPHSPKLTQAALISLIILLLLLSGGSLNCGNSYASERTAWVYPVQVQRGTQALELGTEIKREIVEREAHSYSVKYKSEQNFRVVIEEADVELTVTVIKPDGKMERYTIRNIEPRTHILVAPELRGLYQIEVQSLSGSQKGHYKLKVEGIADAPIPALTQRNDLRRVEEIQAQTQRKKIRIERGEIDSKIREETAKPLNEQINQSEGLLSPSLFERSKATTEMYNSIRDPAEEDAKLYVSLSGTHRTVLARVQRDLPANTTLLSYFLHSDKSVAFIINNRTIIKRDLHTNSKDVVNTVDDFLRFTDISELPLQTLEQWHSWFVSPVESDLETDNLGIIGDGAIQYLPFAAVSKNGKSFFNEKFNLFYLPRLEMISILGGKGGRDMKKLLVVAPGGITGLPFLENSDKEVKNIDKFYKLKKLTGPNATKKNFLEVADKHQIVHMIAHALCDKQVPKLSYIMLTPDTDKDGSLWVEDVSGSRLKNIDLVVLSACETKVCGDYRADEINTLNDAFIAAGIPTVIASLWAVDDLATSLFMSSFYRHLKRMSKAAALAAAQTEIRSKYPHPYYWAAFVLTGDPGFDDRRTKQ